MTVRIKVVPLVLSILIGGTLALMMIMRLLPRTEAEWIGWYLAMLVAWVLSVTSVIHGKQVECE